MPELPETETIARDLDSEVRGRKINKISVKKRDVLREVSARTLAQRLRGATIVRSWRRAKLVVLDLDTGDRIVVQPRFTGALLIDDGNLQPSDLSYSTLKLDLDDGRALHYADVRRLGTFALMSSQRFEEYCGKLGIEPLDRAFTAAHLSAVLRATSQPVKKVLMEQRKIAGIGNIYANEALWRARIDPSRPAASVTAEEAALLRNSIVDVLHEAIEARGTSFRDYRDARGERGGFVEKLDVYGRGGLPCHRCKSKLVATHAIDGRATVMCVKCQH
ncbi:MAG TPA: bifunctional DNA-formamidopyrimidine glycosylase/DNA-(apurinic or apyrimidinic site) lyase [Gemmatimonadaceae bacterium]|nr:bifunctional DNA-formamidopyrimidine glycosylase/DNA-(apurinic or apyrimidinic site) lyase [Gemmatimonadaceae bacterium]